MNAHKVITKLVVFTFFFLITTSSDYRIIGSERKVVSNYTCPDNFSNPNNNSLDIVKAYLNSSGYENDKNSNKIGTISIEQVTVMKTNSDGYACNKLNSFVDQWLDDDPKWKLTYYKSGSTYFLSRWYDGSILGFSPLFVFNSNFEMISAGAY